MSRVKGAHRLRRKLARIDPEVTREVKDSLQDGAEMMQRTAIQLAPPSRRLRAALGDKRAIGRKAKGFRVEFGIRLKRQKRAAWWAHFWEFGTKGFNGVAPKHARHRKTKRPYRMTIPPIRPWHYMEGSLEVNRRPFRRRRERAVNRALRRAAGGI